MSDGKQRYLNVLFISIVLIITAIIYSKSIRFNFINWDDDRQVYENPDIRSLSPANVKKIFSSYYLKMYQPLTTLSFALEFKFKGNNPHIYHFHNMLLHLLNSLLVFILVFMLFRQSLIAALVSFLFALHPMHVESVAWITERKDVLYAFFYLLSLIAYARYLQQQRKAGWLIISGLLFVSSLLSKSAAITLPLVLFLIDYQHGRPIRWNRLPDKIPFLMLSVIFGMISIYSQNIFDPGIEIARQFQFYERLLIGSYAFFFYVIKFIIPFGLSAIHPFPLKSGDVLPLPYFAAFVVLLLTIVAFIWILYRKKNIIDTHRDIVFGILFFCLTIGLVIFMPVGSAFAAERYTYLPYIGLSLVVALLLLNIPNRMVKKVTFGLLVLWMGFLATSTFNRIDVWKKSMTFWDDVIKKYPSRVPIAYQNRGVTLYTQGNYAAAIPDFSMALRLHPGWKDALQYRGLSYFNSGKLQNALMDFDAAILIDQKSVDLYINRGQVKANLGDLNGALSDFSKAISINPNDYLPYYNRGVILSLQGKNTDAYPDFSRSIALNPVNDASYYARAMVGISLGDTMQACNDLKKATELGNDMAKEALVKYCK